jgi:hypothetical protein
MLNEENLTHAAGPELTEDPILRDLSELHTVPLNVYTCPAVAGS